MSVSCRSVMRPLPRSLICCTSHSRISYSVSSCGRPIRDGGSWLPPSMASNDWLGGGGSGFLRLRPVACVCAASTIRLKTKARFRSRRCNAAPNSDEGAEDRRPVIAAPRGRQLRAHDACPPNRTDGCCGHAGPPNRRQDRSEEHTSELQSREK